jgi:hypothetical protein
MPIRKKYAIYLDTEQMAAMSILATAGCMRLIEKPSDMPREEFDRYLDIARDFVEHCQTFTEEEERTATYARRRPVRPKAPGHTDSP